MAPDHTWNNLMVQNAQDYGTGGHEPPPGVVEARPTAAMNGDLPQTVQQACERLAAHCKAFPDRNWAVSPYRSLTKWASQEWWVIDGDRRDEDLSIVAFHFLRAAGFLGDKDA